MNLLAPIRRLAEKAARNWGLKAFSLLFALGLWVFVNLGERDAEKVVSMPVELVNLPAGLAVTGPVVDAIDARLQGPRTLLGTVDDRRQSIQLDLSSVRPGRTSFEIGSQMLVVPRGVRVVRLSPALVSLEIERVVERTVPVELEVTGGIPFGFRVAQREIRPSRARLRGPESLLAEDSALETAPLRLAPIAGPVEKDLALRHPDPSVQVDPDRVTVRLRLEEIVATERFENVEIQVRGREDEVQVRPRWARIEVRGPERLLRDVRLKAPSIYVDGSGLEVGQHDLEVKAALPERIETLAIEPGRVQIVVPGDGNG